MQCSPTRICCGIVGAILLHIVAILLPSAGYSEDDLNTFRGRVVDQDGEAAAGVDVSWFWYANGRGKGMDIADPRRRWCVVGQMEPMAAAATVTDRGGCFSLDIPKQRKTVMALDSDRRYGGIAVIGQDTSSPVTIRLKPLVQLYGQAQFPRTSATMRSTCAAMKWKATGDRLAFCGSVRGDMCFRVPPGTWELDAFGEFCTLPEREISFEDLNAKEDGPNGQYKYDFVSTKSCVRQLELSGKTPFSDVKLQFELSDIGRAQLDGRFGALNKLFGSGAPDWHIVAAEGIEANSQPKGFRGKWLIIEFWRFDCPVCLSKSLPEAVEFYDRHKDFRDQFQIVAFNVDDTVSGTDDFKQRLRTIETKAWHGRRLPFPVALDNTNTTLIRYGIRQYPTVLLVDPSGKLVEGTWDELAKRLAQDGTSGE